MKALWRLLVLAVLAGLALQLYFVARIALMAVVNPESTAFQRSEAWLVTHNTGHFSRFSELVVEDWSL